MAAWLKYSLFFAILGCLPQILSADPPVEGQVLRIGLQPNPLDPSLRILTVNGELHPAETISVLEALGDYFQKLDTPGEVVSVQAIFFLDSEEEKKEIIAWLRERKIDTQKIRFEFPEDYLATQKLNYYHGLTITSVTALLATLMWIVSMPEIHPMRGAAFVLLQAFVAASVTHHYSRILHAFHVLDKKFGESFSNVLQLFTFFGIFFLSNAAFRAATGPVNQAHPVMPAGTGEFSAAEIATGYLEIFAITLFSFVPGVIFPVFDKKILRFDESGVRLPESEAQPKTIAANLIRFVPSAFLILLMQVGITGPKITIDLFERAELSFTTTQASFLVFSIAALLWARQSMPKESQTPSRLSYRRAIDLFAGLVLRAQTKLPDHQVSSCQKAARWLGGLFGRRPK